MENAERNEFDDYIPVIISYDELTDMWSYTIGSESGIADTKEEIYNSVKELIERGWGRND